MSIWLVILAFFSAVLGIVNGILRLTMLSGIINVVIAVGWLFFGTVWMINGIINLKKYIQEKKEKTAEETNG